jgi:SynChlorMet cassette protein ScmC
MLPNHTCKNRTRNISPQVEYCLTLSDGYRWWLSGVDERVSWVDKLATIMELKESRLSGSPKIIFSSKVASDSTMNRTSAFVTAKFSYRDANSGLSISKPDSCRIWYHNNIPDVVCNVKNNESAEIEIINMWFALQPIYQRSMYRGGLPLHAGLVELDGQGILLAAPGDTGKSTCCHRLPDHWQPLSDDESLVVLDKNKRYRAHPFPTWSDYLLKRSEKTWNVQYSLPLSGVFFLEQSATDEAVSLGEGQAAVLMNESASQVCERFWRALTRKDQRPFREEIFNNACEMAKQIPAYRLRVSLHGRFWEKMEQALG